MMGSDFQFFTRKGATNLFPTFPRAGGKIRLGNPVVMPVTISFSVLW